MGGTVPTQVFLCEHTALIQMYFNVQTLPNKVKDIVNMHDTSMLTDFQPNTKIHECRWTEIRVEITSNNVKREYYKQTQYRKENFGEVFPLLNNVYYRI